MGFSRQEHWSGLPFPPPKETTERKKVKSLSHVRLFATPWTIAYQAPPSMEFSRQEYWSGLPFPSPRPPQKTKKGSQSPALQRQKGKKFKGEVVNSNGIPDLPRFCFLSVWSNGILLITFFFLTKKMLHCSEEVTWKKKSTVFEDLKYLI